MDRTAEEKSSKMQVTIGRTLTYGVLAATIIVAIGVLLMVAEGATGYTCDLSSLNCLLSYNSSTIPHGDYPNSLASIVGGLLNARPFAIIELGILVLLATPVMRVGISVLVFGIEKDKAFVLITVCVLSILLFSFFVVPFIPFFHA